MAGEAFGYAAARKAVDLYAGGNRDLCWGTMIYACVGVKFPRLGREAKPSCGHQERYWVGVGVEGPPALRAAVIEATKGQKKKGWEEGWVEEFRSLLDSIDGVSFIPSPFYAGRCPKCGSEMQHVAWHQDEEFPDDLRLAPVHARYFCVPDEAKAWQYVAEGYGGAELVEGGMMHDPMEPPRFGLAKTGNGRL